MVGSGGLPPPISHPPEFLLFSPWLFFWGCRSESWVVHTLAQPVLSAPHQTRHALQPLAPSLRRGGPLPSPRGLSRVSRDISCLNTAPVACVCLPIACICCPWPPCLSVISLLCLFVSCVFLQLRLEETYPSSLPPPWLLHSEN